MPREETTEALPVLTLYTRFVFVQMMYTYTYTYRGHRGGADYKPPRRRNMGRVHAPTVNEHSDRPRDVRVDDGDAVVDDHEEPSERRSPQGQRSNACYSVTHVSARKV